MYETNQFESTANKKKFFLWNWLNLKKANNVPEFAWDGAGFTKLYFYPNTDSLRIDTLVNGKWLEKKSLLNYSNYSTSSPNDTRKLIKTYNSKSIVNNLILNVKQFGFCNFNVREKKYFCLVDRTGTDMGDIGIRIPIFALLTTK